MDVDFDVRSDAGGRDPDVHSPTLRRYHQLLWSKPLPSGHHFTLSTDTPGTYLHHRSYAGEFWLSSDAISHSLSSITSMRSVLASVPPGALESFYTLNCTIGSYLVFPGNTINRKPTVNGARGMHPRIRDRFDLTLECIRRFYVDEANPLGEVLHRYSDYFSLFEDFETYVEFFLLQDLVDDHGSVRFHLPFEGFDQSPLPATTAHYLEYRAASMTFVAARNRRTRSWNEAHLRCGI